MKWSWRYGGLSDGRTEDLRSSPWTRPPERPARYRLSKRLSDMACGFLDGRKGIPDLSDLDALRTPRINAILSEANESFETERCHLIEDRARLRRQLTSHQITLETSAKELLTAQNRLTEAQVPLTPEQSELRRLAEADQARRPLGLVTARRQAAWDRRLVTAEQQYQSVTARGTQARHEAQLRLDLMVDREEAAYSAIRRHHELAHRRIATYLQQLVRTHPQGRKLNGLMAELQVGPDLPEWTKEPGEFPSADGRES